MSFKNLCMIVWFYQCSSTTIIAEQQERNENCSSPYFRMDSGGNLESHKFFMRDPYPNNYSCDWKIIAPKSFLIMIQFNFLNIQAEPNCLFDFIEFVFSENKTERLCGNDDKKRIISITNTVLVRFRSDKTFQLEGFSARYWFVKVEAERLPMTKSGGNCTDIEFECVDDHTCIQKTWICDSIRDCRDNSDEMNCEFRLSCHQSKKMCNDGNCLSWLDWCNVFPNCADRSDEDFCRYSDKKRDIVLDNPKDTHRCSFQPIKPQNVNIKIDNPQIVGGEESIDGSWPWMASLRFGSSHYCGATLISKSWAVTAAHCFENYPRSTLWQLDLGRHYIDNDGHLQRIKVSKVVIHPRYDAGTIQNDIALLKLERNATLTNRVQTLCLAERQPRTRQRCVILGWGETRGSGAEGVLKQAILPIVDHKECNQIYSDVTDDMICAGFKKGGVDACQQDSGGPLICENNDLFELNGITSWGAGCALPDKPGVYTNVLKYVSWIRENVQDLYPK